MLKKWLSKSGAKAYIYPTLQCNLSCRMCYSGSYTANVKNADEFTISEHKESIDKLYENGVRLFDISGGEPLLSDILEEIVRYIKEKGDTIIYLVSNGTLVKEKYKIVKEIIPDIDRFFISLDSPIPEIHNIIRGSKSAFSDAFEGLYTLKKLSFDNIGINFVVMRQNKNHIIDLLKLAYENNIRYVNLLRLLDVSKRGTLHNENLDLDAYIQCFKEVQTWALNKAGDPVNKMMDVTLVMPGYCFASVTELKKPVLNSNIKLDLQFDPFMGCPAFSSDYVVGISGEIAGCTSLVGCNEFTAGHIIRDGNDDINHSREKMRNLLNKRKKYLKNTEPCSQCEFWRYCQGGCPSIAVRYFGDIMKCDPTCEKCLK